ncbi:hypothetical protein LOTGIDRAFT_117300 [Lottia gigantea]|uniref:Uncharacterized protein n=1 Tax=Lottia gigantea TaxID=225164 RepID=V4AK52_LOTGI|nr:hypothetical protein LOTGIDRAFT_117300 [Lottia gigantea]ESO95110.1 hypothetical protein LOTGIDRAFT_117300 [Lottia gigantea]
MCFYGETTPSRNLSRYIRSVEYILKCYRDQQIKKPLIVNTLGWNEGLGVHIIVDLIHMIQPSIIIQLRCEYNYNNFPILTHEYLSHTPGWLYNTDRSLTIKSNQFQEQNLLVIDSDVPTKHKTEFKAAHMRELSLLAYLNQNLKIGWKLFHVEPYAIDFNQVAVHDCQSCGSYSQILYALNASVVGLCEADLTKVDKRLENGLRLFKETPIFNCVGLGIVRAIDIKKKCLYIICPIPQEKLLNVNLLVKGAIHLPDTMYLEYEKSEETLEMPYIGYLPKSLGSKALVVRNKMPRKQYLNNKS